MCNKTIPPGKRSSTIALILSSSTNLGVRLPIGLHGVFLGAFIAFPLLLAVFSAEMLLNSGEIAESPRRIVMNTGSFRTNINPLLHFLARPLLQLPWQIMPPPMQLQILVPLKSFTANFAHESVRRHQSLRRQSNHLRIWIRHSGEIPLFLGGGFGRGILIAGGGDAGDASIAGSGGGVIQVGRHRNWGF